MKKIILLITTLFILSGCNVEYELNITNDNDYIENINIISENSNESSIINSYAKPIEAFDNSGNYSESLEEIPGVEYYDLSKSLNSNNLYNLNLKYQFNYDNFNESNIINHSVSVLKIDDERGVYILNTGATLKIFEMYDINEMTIKITLDDNLEVVNSNASSNEGNTYYWHVNNDNYKTSPITFSYQEKKEEVPNDDNNEFVDNDNNLNDNAVDSTNDILLVVLITMIFIVVLSAIIIISKRIKK